MVTRSLTEVYILMRNNAIHSRQIYAEQSGESDRVHLVQSSSRDVEQAGLELRGDSHLPPPWVDALEEVQYVMSRLRTKLEELRAMQARHLQRPGLDEGGAEEAHVSRLTGELARHFGSAHRLLQGIRQQARQGTEIEKKLGQNVILALVTTLQELSLSFRSAQSGYLKSLTSREERSNAYFELPNFEELSLDDNTELLPGFTNNQADAMLTFGASGSGLRNNKNSSAFFAEEEGDIDQMFQKPLQAQKQLLHEQEENTRVVAEREQEVNKIVRSITDLNEIFKDLGHMVHEQGTVLDRIDYNIEQTQVQVQEGYKQLKKAEGYQRKNRKMQCIFILGIAIVILIIMLIIVKS